MPVRGILVRVVRQPSEEAVARLSERPTGFVRRGTDFHIHPSEDVAIALPSKSTRFAGVDPGLYRKPPFALTSGVGLVRIALCM
jgi:hypothetical protein